MPPPQLDYATSTYLTLTSRSSPTSILSSSNASPASSSSGSGPAPSPQVSYVGTVGALPDEHIFEVRGVPSPTTAEQLSERVEEVKKRFEARDDVKNVQVLVPHQRARRQ
ncbi:hypothetical protein JCM10212_002481 [Sporobolomyces blumeae]